MRDAKAFVKAVVALCVLEVAATAIRFALGDAERQYTAGAAAANAALNGVFALWGFWLMGGRDAR